MGSKATITCDFDGKDLTENSEGVTKFRLVVSPEQIPLAAGVSVMHAAAPIEGTHFFCGLACVVGWAAKKIDENKKAAAEKKPG